MGLTLFEKEKPMYGIAVDCGCSGNPGDAEYKGVLLQTGDIIFEYKIPGLCTNNIAEFAALCFGVKYLIENNIKGKVYSDSKTALSWYRNGSHKSTLEKKNSTICAFNILDNSIRELPKNGRMLFVDFWNNRLWGETPADYGRK